MNGAYQLHVEPKIKVQVNLLQPKLVHNIVGVYFPSICCYIRESIVVFAGPSSCVDLKFLMF